MDIDYIFLFVCNSELLKAISFGPVNRIHFTPSRVFLASWFSYFYGCIQPNIYYAVSVGLLWLAYHLATLVHSTLVCIRFIPLYGMHGPLSCFVLYRLRSLLMCLYFYTGFGCFLLLTAYRLSVQSILIAYLYRCVQCTRYCCRHFLIFGKWALLSVLYLTLYRYADSVFLFFAYRNYLAVPLIWSLWESFYH